MFATYFFLGTLLLSWFAFALAFGRWVSPGKKSEILQGLVVALMIAMIFLVLLVDENGLLIMSIASFASLCLGRSEKVTAWLKARYESAPRRYMTASGATWLFSLGALSTVMAIHW